MMRTFLNELIVRRLLSRSAENAVTADDVLDGMTDLFSGTSGLNFT